VQFSPPAKQLPPVDPLLEDPVVSLSPDDPPLEEPVVSLPLEEPIVSLPLEEPMVSLPLDEPPLEEPVVSLPLEELMVSLPLDPPVVPALVGPLVPLPGEDIEEAADDAALDPAEPPSGLDVPTAFKQAPENASSGTAANHRGMVLPPIGPRASWRAAHG
jgi:hypothetical protein